MDYLKIVQEKVALKEGIGMLEQYLKALYLEGRGMASKKLANYLNIPIPLVVAIKKEFIKLDLIKQENGILLTAKGHEYVDESLGFQYFDIELYKELQNSAEKRSEIINELSREYEEIFEERPQANVTIDQAKATTETSFHRAMLCLQCGMLINRKILCIGDDDFVSVAIGLLLKRMYRNLEGNTSEVFALDVDERIVAIILDLAENYGLPIRASQIDFREPLPIAYANYYDVVFTDPPYTASGLTLFVSRGISAMKKEKGGKVFLSFGQKPPNETQELQRIIIEHGLSISSVMKGFNEYEGASLLGGSSQMMILDTTDYLKSQIGMDEVYSEKIYTADFRDNTTRYVCKHCKEEYVVGRKQKIETIEQLKQQGCGSCGETVFIQQKKEIPEGGHAVEKVLGRHILADFFECDKDILADVELVQQYMHEAADKANASIVTEDFHHFNPWGVSGAIIIKESHLTIHTWPEYGYAAIDIFTCGNSLDLWEALFWLKKKLKSDKMEHSEISRGRVRETN